MVAYDGGLAVDFGAPGVYYYNGAAWNRLNPNDPDWLGTYGGKLVADFGAKGLYEYDGASWSRIRNRDADNTGITTVAYDTGLVVDFGASGVYYYDGVTWDRINANDPEWLRTYGDKLVADFGSRGLYEYDGTSWSRIRNDDADNTANTLVPYDAGLAVDFGASDPVAFEPAASFCDAGLKVDSTLQSGQRMGRAKTSGNPRTTTPQWGHCM